MIMLLNIFRWGGGGKNMTEGARILQPLICNTLAGGKSITVIFLPGARIKGRQEYYGTPEE